MFEAALLSLNIMTQNNKLFFTTVKLDTSLH